MSAANDNNDNKLLALAVNNIAKELRCRRRWGLFFKTVFLAIVTTILFLLIFSRDGATILGKKPHVALIKLDGVIADGGPVDAGKVNASLERAFTDKGTRGIILRINSPGGSPVQASDIYNEITRLRGLYPKIPVYAVCTDLCASAAYFVAAAAQTIYVNPSSLVGSIGVTMSGFGFAGAMQKLGIARRVIIAGQNKDFMDSYVELKPKDRRFAQMMIDEVHRYFIAAVKVGRGKRLHQSADIFSGRIWTGAQAKKLGLVDAYGSVSDVARDVIKQTKIIDYTINPSLFDHLTDRLATSMANVMVNKSTLHLNA